MGGATTFDKTVRKKSPIFCTKERKAMEGYVLFVVT